MDINFLNITQNYGTPIYVYDFEKISNRIKVLKKLFNDKVKLFYAVKANSNLKILEYLKPIIDGLDISSGGEIRQALLSGYQAEFFSFAGPGKNEDEINYSIQKGCGSISIESIDDFMRIINTSLNLKMKPNLSIRINPLKLINKFALKMGGKSTQFGIDEENFKEIHKQMDKYRDNINFIGYHIYSGTQCLDAEALNENFSYIFDMLERIIMEYKLFPKKINLGGGFGIPYYSGQNELNIEKVCAHVNKCIESYGVRFKCNEYIIELGRYIIGEFGYYLSKILAIKESREKKFLIIDGGLHQNLSASGNLGQVIKKNYKIEILNKDNSKISYEIAGCLCTPIDILGNNVELNKAKTGDILIFNSSGAYGYTASPLLFLGHETPREILFYNNKFEIIREAKNLTCFN